MESLRLPKLAARGDGDRDINDRLRLPRAMRTTPTYQRVIDKSITGALSDSLLGGVGFFF